MRNGHAQAFTIEDEEEADYPPGRKEREIAPAAAFKQSSKETEFELDSPTLSPQDQDLSDIPNEDEIVLEGLLQSGRRRQSTEVRENEVIDLDALPTGGSLISAILNMSNSILGAGICALPYAVREAGFFSGLCLLILLGALTDWTIRLIVLNAKLSGQHTYIDIMDSCFGAKGRAAVSFFQFSFAFGGMAAFGVIIGDTIPHVLRAFLPQDLGSVATFLTSRQFVILFLTFTVSYPLSLYRDIHKLSKASGFALVSMLTIIIAIAVRGPQLDSTMVGDPYARWSFISGGFFEAIGVISFAYVCHGNTLLIYGSLRTRTIDRFDQVTHISTALAVVASMIMSITGFMVFTNKTQGNILNNFAADDVLINIARACFGCNMVTTTPLENFVCREVIEIYFWPGEQFSQKRHFLVTTAIVIAATSISLLTCDLGLVLELTGGFAASALAFIFPPMCYLKLAKQSTPRMQFLAKGVAYFGVAVMVLSTILSLTKAYYGTKEAKQCA